jgi:hypothetical protein
LAAMLVPQFKSTPGHPVLHAQPKEKPYDIFAHKSPPRRLCDLRGESKVDLSGNFLAGPCFDAIDAPDAEWVNLRNNLITDTGVTKQSRASPLQP